MGNFSFAKMVGILFLFCAAMTITSPAQTLSTLVSFDGTDGANPFFGPLVQGTNGKLYGTTFNGGANSQGTIFEVTATGQFTALYNFCSNTNCTDGANPEAGLVQATNGNFYGTTDGGGAHGSGTVFEITPGGKFKTLYSFCSRRNCTDGAAPTAALVQGSDGNFYGTTFAGGGTLDDGTVFKITPAGKLTTLYTFCSQVSGVVCLDGSSPYAGLVQGINGNFYGTTYVGGDNDSGIIFEITPQGRFTRQYSFCPQSLPCTDGKNPSAGLVQALNGDFYGTTVDGGAGSSGTVFRIANGKLTTLYTFCGQTNCTDGALPFAGLVQGSNGNFYGTTQSGGANRTCSGSCGTIFEITPEGTLTTLYSFCSETNCADGDWPYARLMRGIEGRFYGGTYYGGPSGNCNHGCGTIFSLSLGLGHSVARAEPSAVVTRWDEKAGLRPDAIRFQVINMLEAQEIKETGNADD